jgi:CheY-like chemotaxis protein
VSPLHTEIPAVLVVEDEATQQHILTEYLTRQGLSVSAVSNGALMRASLATSVPRIVLLDVGLPGEDGFALARWLRERYPRLGIIMVTGATDMVDRIVGLETGADDYDTKPFDCWHVSRVCCAAPSCRCRRIALMRYTRLRSRSMFYRSPVAILIANAGCWSTPKVRRRR